jgi:phage terminase Nu1 subunit (DNA packaging protein)
MSHSVETIAKLLDMTSRRVQQLVKEGVIPRPKSRGQYEIMPCVVGYIRHLNAMLNGDEGDLLTERTRLTRLQAEKIELDIAEREERLIEVAAAERAWSEMVGAFRAKALNIPVRAAIEVTGKSERQAEAILTDMIFEALAELSNWRPSENEDDETTPVAGDHEGGDAGRAADLIDDQPMGG